VTTPTSAGALERLGSRDFARLCRENGVSLAVLFGSRATGKAGEGSDIDLAVWLDGTDQAAGTRLEARRRLLLLRQLINYLKTDRVDMVVLNRASPLMKFQVARHGKPLFQKKPTLFADFCSRALREHGDARVFYQATEAYLQNSIKRKKHLVDILIARRKLQKMASYLSALAERGSAGLEDYRADFGLRLAVERLIQVIVDAAVDLNVHAVVDAGNPPPVDAYNSFLEAAAAGLLPKSLAEKLAPATGERNIIVHRYEEIDDTIVYESIGEIVTLFNQYVEEVDKYLRQAGGGES